MTLIRSNGGMAVKLIRVGGSSNIPAWLYGDDGTLKGGAGNDWFLFNNDGDGSIKNQGDRS